MSRTHLRPNATELLLAQPLAAHLRTPLATNRAPGAQRIPAPLAQRERVFYAVLWERDCAARLPTGTTPYAQAMGGPS